MCREAPAPAPSTPFQYKTQFHEEMIRPGFALDTNLTVVVLGGRGFGPGLSCCFRLHFQHWHRQEGRAAPIPA